MALKASIINGDDFCVSISYIDNNGNWYTNRLAYKIRKKCVIRYIVINEKKGFHEGHFYELAIFEQYYTRSCVIS